MAIDCSDPVRLFRDDFPRGFLGEVVRQVQAIYIESHALMKGELKDEELAAAWGVFRRARIEGDLRGVAAKHRLQARPERNDSGSFHTVVESARFWLTESRVSHAAKLPKKARFRDLQALNNTPLFAMIEPLDLPEDKKFAVILIHGPSKSDGRRLGFAMIRFPNASFTQWLDSSINLLDEFPDSAASVEEFRQEVIPRPIDPQIRTDLAGKGSS